jgi:hypothetical protein
MRGGLLTIAEAEDLHRKTMGSSTVAPGTDVLEYRFRWSAAEHRTFYRAVQREVSRRGFLRFIVPGALVVFAVVALVAMLGSDLPVATVALTLAPYVILFLLWIALLKWGLAYVNARAYRRAHAACIPHDQIRVISAEGLEARCVTSTVKVRWPGIARVIETQDHFLFFTTPSCAIQLPKQAVPGSLDLDRLREVLRAHVGERAELAKPQSVAPEG